MKMPINAGFSFSAAVTRIPAGRPDAGNGSGSHARMAALLLLFVILIGPMPPSASGQVNPDTVLTIERNDGLWILNASGAPLAEVVHRLETQMAIAIAGLEAMPDRPITFSARSPSAEHLLRNLLGYLGERNIAFEYTDDRLTAVTVLPQGTDAANRVPIADEAATENPMTSVVEVVGVVEESQAEKLELKPGDYIVEYDGTRIAGYEQLIDATTRDIGPTPVKMVVLREGKRLDFYLERDFIGVHIRTKWIPRKDLPAW